MLSIAVLLLVICKTTSLQCYNLSEISDVDTEAWSLEPTNGITALDYNHSDGRRLSLRPLVNWNSDKIQALRVETAHNVITGWVTFIPVANPINPLVIGADDHLSIWNNASVPGCSCELQSDGTLSTCFGDRLFENGCLGSTYTPSSPCYHGLVDERYCHTRYRFYMSAQWCYSYDPNCSEESWMNSIMHADPPNSAWNKTYTTSVPFGDGTRNSICRRYLEWNVIEIRFDTRFDIAVGSNVSLITDFAVESKVAVDFDIEVRAVICINDDTLTESEITVFVAQYIDDLAEYLELSEIEIGIIEKRIIGKCNFADDGAARRRRLEEKNVTEGTAIIVRTIVLPIDILRVEEIKTSVQAVGDNLVTRSSETSLLDVVIVDHSITDPPTPPPKQEEAFTWDIAVIVVVVLFIVGFVGICFAVGKDAELESKSRKRKRGRAPGKWRVRYKRVQGLPSDATP